MSKIKPIVREIRGNALWDGIKFILWIAGVALLNTGVLTVLARYFSTITPDAWLIIVTFLLSFLFINIGFLIARRQRKRHPESLPTPKEENLNTENSRVAEQLNERIEELEREKTALEKARDYASNLYERARKEIETKDIQISSRDSELETLKSKYGWLHEQAERDKRGISKYVYIIFSKVKYEGLDEIEPHIEIFFNIINASVYSIIIDKDIKGGAVYFNSTELNPKQAKIDGSLHPISRGENEKRFLVIKQWVSPELAKRIKNPQPNDELYFNRLWLSVSGGESNPEVVPGRLSLPSSIPIKVMPSPSEQPLLEEKPAKETTVESEAQETKAAKRQRTIDCLPPYVTPTIFRDNILYETDKSDKSFDTAIVEFVNSPNAQSWVRHIQYLQAQITYYDSKGNFYYRVGKCFWLTEKESYVHLADDRARLAIALAFDSTVLAPENLNNDRQEYEKKKLGKDWPKPLVGDSFRVQVNLTSGDLSGVREAFTFALTCQPELKISLIES
jgi:hypothetical protein